MTKVRGILSLLVIVAMGCATAPKSTQARQTLVDRARTALSSMQATDPSLAPTLQSSYAYAVFPDVGEGGFIVGATYGKGVVFSNTNQVLGYADLTAASAGALVGGQTFDELIVFQDRNAFDRMRNQGLSFRGEASATALNAGVAAATQFRNGVAVFVQPIGGLMANLSIGGQDVRYVSQVAASQ